jgi:topoisomerase-4 subunit A
MSARGKAGKVFLSLEPKELPLAPVGVSAVDEIACTTSDGRGLVFPVVEVKEMPRGKGIKLIEIEGRQKMSVVAVIEGIAPGIKPERMRYLRAGRGGKGRSIKS